MKSYNLFLLCFSLFVMSCNSNTVDWSTIYGSARDEHNKYLRTFCKEHYHNALNMYDEIAEESSELRNRALYSKVTIMTHAQEYDSAVNVAKQIHDTSNIFNSFYNKSILINTIMVYKSQSNNDNDEVKRYSKYIVDELKPIVTEKRDSIYIGISNHQANKSFDSDNMSVSNQTLVPFMLYLNYLYLYDASEFMGEIQAWKDGFIGPNENIENFFKSMENMAVIQ